MSENNPDDLNKNYDKENLNQALHYGVGGKNPEDPDEQGNEDGDGEANDESGTTGEKRDYNAEKKPGAETEGAEPKGGLGRVREALDRRRQNSQKKQKPGNDVKNVAGAVEGNPVAIAKLAKDPKKVGLGCCLGCSPFFFFICIVMLIVVVAASSATISSGVDDGYCKSLPTLSAEEKAELEKSPNMVALKEAEQRTGVYRMLIGAIDYKEDQVGVNLSEKGMVREAAAVFTDIGNRIQAANYARKGDGTLNTNDKGEPIKNLPHFTGNKSENMLVAVALIHYQCVFVDHKDQASNLNDPSIVQDCFSGSAQKCLQNGIKDPWMTGRNASIISNDVGAFLFYLMINRTKACSGVTGGNASAPGPGKPGECKRENGGSIASVPSFLQCDDRWGSQPTIGGSGTGLCSGGCGLTSITMVLNWYGKNVTPLDTINYLNANPPVPYANGWSTTMYPGVAQNYGMIAEVNNFGWEDTPIAPGIKTRLKNCEPIVVGNLSGSWAYTDHLVVLTGMDGAGNVFVNDPAPIGGGPSQFSVPEQDVSNAIGNKIYVHN